MEAKITPSQLKEASYARVVYAATVGANTQPDEVLSPVFWAHVSTKFQPSTRIEVTTEDGTWFQELYVVSCGRNWAKVCRLRFVELSESSPLEEHDAAEQYSVTWAGNEKKHRVVRLADKVELKCGFQMKKEAQAWLDDYLVALSV